MSAGLNWPAHHDRRGRGVALDDARSHAANWPSLIDPSATDSMTLVASTCAAWRCHRLSIRNRPDASSAARLSSWRRKVYQILTRGRIQCFGELPGHPLFWGDLCKEKVTYVRNFVFDDINTLAQCSFMPYQDPMRPYVNRWFASSKLRFCSGDNLA